MAPHDRCDVLILGAGPSGLLCALEAARRGRSVTLVDQAAQAGPKIRIAGGGRCNVTNLGAAPEKYCSANPRFVSSALARFTPHDLLELLRSLGLDWVEEERGRIFLDHGTKGGTLLAEKLVATVRELGVKVLLETPILDLSHSGGVFAVEVPGRTLRAPALVVALGGLAWPQLGAGNLGYTLARRFGLECTPLHPGLTPLAAGTELLDFCRGLSGTALPVRIRVPLAPAAAEPGKKRKAGPTVKEISGDLLFTHRGISGPAVLDASLFWRKGGTLSLDLLPGVHLVEALAGAPRQELRNALGRFLPKRLAVALCEALQLQGSVAQLPRKELQRLEELLHAWPFTPADAEGYNKAEVTLGGVDTSGVSSQTLAAKGVPGLWLTGEVLDVTGRLGGYNLQWAWSSGVAAGRSL